MAGGASSAATAIMFARRMVMASTLARNARIVRYALERDPVEFPGFRGLFGAQVMGENLRDRLAGLRIDRGPARDLVGLVGFDRLAVVERHVGDAVEIGRASCRER